MLIDQPRLDSRRARTFDVDRIDVAGKFHFVRTDTESLERPELVQLPDGGWSLYEGGPPNISATIKAYFAMKVAGVSVDDPAMEQARARVRDR